MGMGFGGMGNDNVSIGYGGVMSRCPILGARMYLEPAGEVQRSLI